MALKKRMAKDVILTEVLGSLSMRKRNSLINKLTAHYNNLIEEHCATITNRLDQLKFNYILQKTYDNNNYLVYTVDMIQFNCEILIAQKTIERDIIEKSDYDNIHLIKTLIELDDEFNFKQNSYNECRRTIKKLYEYLSSRINVSYDDCRNMSIEEIEQLFLMSYKI